MADWYGVSGDGDGNHRAGLHLAIWQDSYDSATGLSFVKWYLDYYDNATNVGGIGTSNWSATINGTGYSGSVAYDFSSNSGRSYRLVDNTAGTWVSGSSVGGTGHVDANSPVGTTDVSGTLTLATLPSAPSGAPSMYRSTDGATVTVISQAANGNGITLSGYEVRFSTDGSNWGYQIPMNQGGYNLTGATPTSPYYAQTRAVNVNGYAGPWSATGGIAGIPSAPSAAPTITRTSNGSTVTVTTSGAAGNGWNVSSYVYQLSTDGTNWSSQSPLTNGTATISVTPTSAYYFRTAGINGIGQGSWSSAAFIAGIPSAPSAEPTLSRSSDGVTVTVTSASAAGNGNGPSGYVYRTSYDGTTWNAQAALSQGAGTFTLTATQTVYVQTAAVNSIGQGAWSGTTTVVGIPTAPSSATATRTARNVTVVAGNSTGSGITGYFVQYSTNGGSSWSTAQPMTSQSYTYTNLTAALTYTFRVYSTNSIGASATTSSATVFVPAGGKRWDGTAWTSTTTAKRWDGTNWVDLSTAKRWDGTNWVDLS